MVMPLWQDRICTAPEVKWLRLFGFGESRLKRIPTGHMSIDIITAIDSVQSQVRERPLPGIEAISLIDEMGRVLSLLARLTEDCLPAICVPGPFIEHQHTGEICCIFHSGEHAFRQVVEDHIVQRIHWVAGAQVPAGAALHRMACALKTEFWSVLDQPTGNFDRRHIWYWQSKPLAQP